MVKLEAITWNQKILFALGRLENGFVQGIVNEILKFSSEVDEETLFKKITGLASLAKTNKILGAKQVGNKFKYYIK